MSLPWMYIQTEGEIKDWLLSFSDERELLFIYISQENALVGVFSSTYHCCVKEINSIRCMLFVSAAVPELLCLIYLESFLKKTFRETVFPPCRVMIK